MYTKINITLTYFFSLITLSFVISQIIYIGILKSNKQKLNFLYIPADKSPTNARLLGGLGTSVSLLSTIAFMFVTNYFYPFLQLFEKQLLLSAAVSIFSLTIAGYIDDRFELRARYKLLFQFASITSFSYYSAIHLSNAHPELVFGFCVILGVILLNGTNLLDGLDSMTIKLGSVINFGFIFISLKTNNLTLLSLSMATFASLSAFHFYGREPAKIYMGEIGGSIVGFIFYIQSIFAYSELTSYGNGYYSAGWLLIVTALPMCELSISFLRRIVMGKSPFRGDKLHLHHIIKNKYALSPSATSTSMATTLALIIAGCSVLAEFTNSLIGAGFSIFLINFIYVKTCIQDWRNTQNKRRVENLFLYFEDKPVFVVDTDLLKNIKPSIAISEKSGKKKAA